MTALYNEIDPAAAAVLRQCIADGVIAPGHVETRSIKELTADDVADQAQVHLFAGGGLWSVAARLAGWPDDRPLWTASCPCQPFSQAGQGRGTDDPRHLWPDVDRLVDGLADRGRLPPVIVGEQVAGAAGYAWFNGVRADLARKGYRARVVDIPACAVDAPHIRQRLYWVAMVASARLGRGQGRPEHELRRGRAAIAGADAPERALGHAILQRLEGQPRHGDGAEGWALPARSTPAPDGGCRNGDMADHDSEGRRAGHGDDPTHRHGHPAAPTHGRNGSVWSGAEWIICHDDKARRAEPSIRLLVDGLPGRVDLWRIGGNAIVPVLAAEVLAALMETLDGALA